MLPRTDRPCLRSLVPKLAIFLVGLLAMLAQASCAAPKPLRTVPKATRTVPTARPGSAASLGAAPAFSCAWAADIKPLWSHVYNAKTDRRLPMPPVGNGTEDDLPALNADIIWINRHGGGVLFLPAGTYRLDNTRVTLEMLSNTVLEGEGMDRTTLTYGDRNGTGAGLAWHDVNLAGIYNLALRSMTAPEAAPYDISQCEFPTLAYNARPQRVFWKSVRWEIGSNRYMVMDYITHFDIEDCLLDGTAANHGIFSFGGCTDLLFTRNYVHYKSGRPSFGGGRGTVIRNNQFVRDGDLHQVPRAESGGPDISYCAGLLFTGNLVTTHGACDYTQNYGEALLAQDDGGAPPSAQNFGDTGALTAAAGATITDTSKHWEEAWVANVPLYVAITSGAALGQMRAIVSHTADTVTLDAPWSASATPAPGDQYCVTSWELKDATISKNTFWNNPYPLSICSGGVNITITDNTLINSEGIYLGAIDYGARHFPLWNTTTTGNKISNPNGLRCSYVCIIAVTDKKTAAPRHANLTWHNTVTGNTLIPHPAGAHPTHSPDGTGRDGIFLRTDGWGGDPLTISDTIHTYALEK